ncbi:hypothetical protein CapIbe_022610 [Capra ibex]
MLGRLTLEKEVPVTEARPFCHARSYPGWPDEETEAKKDPGHHEGLRRAPCALQQALISYLLYTEYPQRVSPVP